MIRCEMIFHAFAQVDEFRKRYLRDNILLLYMDGLVDTALVSRQIEEPIRQGCSVYDIPLCTAREAENEQEVIAALLRGKAALLQNGACVVADVRKTEKRSVSPPEEESAVNGSKDSFVEEMKTNLTLLRKKLVTAKLKTVRKQVGTVSHTAVAIVFLEGVASARLVSEAEKILSSVRTEAILTPDILEQYLSSRLYSVFPQTLQTQRPDKAAQNLIKGRIVLLVDGLPVAFVLPATLAQLMQTPEDDSVNFIFASLVRLLRYTLLFVELFFAGTYVALTTFHVEMLPEKLALSISQARQGVPFPVIFEILVMMALFEVLIEAGMHMSQNTGQAVSIVGALVVGEAAIEADLVSPAALIVVAVSAIASFAMPDQMFSNGLRLYRLAITLAGAVLGLFGVVMVGLVLMVELASLESFGTPFLAPLAGVSKVRWKDTLLVVPSKKEHEK